MKVLPHEWDYDGGCIHCGLDGADVPKPYSENMPICSVQNEEKRAENRAEATQAFLDDKEWDNVIE